MELPDGRRLRQDVQVRAELEEQIKGTTDLAERTALITVLAAMRQELAAMRQELAAMRQKEVLLMQSEQA